MSKRLILIVGFALLGVSIFFPSAFGDGEDDELFILPGEGIEKKEQKREERAEYSEEESKLAPKYFPPKEWQSFRSTAQITSAVFWRGYLWAATESGGLIRWQVWRGDYRFFIPRLGKLEIRKISAVTAAPNGDIWIAAKGFGVARWDRETGRWIFFRRGKALPDDYAQALAWVGDSLWVGTRRGVARYRKGRWKKWTTRNGLPGADIRAIGSDGMGRVWFSPNISKPFYWSGGGFVRERGTSVIGATCIVSDRKEGVWFCTDQGAAHLKRPGGETVVYSPSEGLPASLVRSIYVDRKGAVWVGTDRGLGYFSNGKWLALTRRDGLPGDDVRAVLGTQRGQILVATYLNGVALYSGGRWKRLGLGIAGNQIRTIAYAPDGSVWVGTASGVSRYYRGYWYNLTSILPNPDVRTITFDPAGRAWLGTYGGGIVRFDGKKHQVFDVMYGLASNRIIASALTPEGLWFAHEVKGLSRFDGKNWRTYGREQTSGLLPSPYPITAMMADRNFNLWIATSGGGVIIKKYRGKWSRFPYIRPGTASGAVYALAEDPEGNIWIGTKAGLFLFSNGKVTKYTKDDGLIDNRIYSLAVEGNKVWIGTKLGVACFQKPAWRRFTKEDGLISNFITAILVTPFGEKWFGSAFDGLTVYRGL